MIHDLPPYILSSSHGLSDDAFAACLFKLGTVIGAHRSGITSSHHPLMYNEEKSTLGIWMGW